MLETGPKGAAELAPARAFVNSAVRAWDAFTVARRPAVLGVLAARLSRQFDGAFRRLDMVDHDMDDVEREFEAAVRKAFRGNLDDDLHRWGGQAAVLRRAVKLVCGGTRERSVRVGARRASREYVTAAGGATEAGRKLAGTVLAVGGESTVARRENEHRGMDDIATGFGRYVSNHMAARYADAIAEWLGRAPMAATTLQHGFAAPDAVSVSREVEARVALLGILRVALAHDRGGLAHTDGPKVQPDPIAARLLASAVDAAGAFRDAQAKAYRCSQARRLEPRLAHAFRKVKRSRDYSERSVRAALGAAVRTPEAVDQLVALLRPHGDGSRGLYAFVTRSNQSDTGRAARRLAVDFCAHSCPPAPLAEVDTLARDVSSYIWGVAMWAMRAPACRRDTAQALIYAGGLLAAQEDSTLVAETLQRADGAGVAPPPEAITAQDVVERFGREDLERTMRAADEQRRSAMQEALRQLTGQELTCPPLDEPRDP